MRSILGGISTAQISGSGAPENTPSIELESQLSSESLNMNGHRRTHIKKRASHLERSSKAKLLWRAEYPLEPDGEWSTPVELLETQAVLHNSQNEPKAADERCTMCLEHLASVNRRKTVRAVNRLATDDSTLCFH